MRVPLVSSSSTTMAEEFTKFELHVPTPADWSIHHMTKRLDGLENPLVDNLDFQRF